jgi:hypothetical protein
LKHSFLFSAVQKGQLAAVQKICDIFIQAVSDCQSKRIEIASRQLCINVHRVGDKAHLVPDIAFAEDRDLPTRKGW